jgi:hypothetical protein
MLKPDAVLRDHLWSVSPPPPPSVIALFANCTRIVADSDIGPAASDKPAAQLRPIRP